MIKRIFAYDWHKSPFFQEINDFLPRLVIDTHTHASPSIIDKDMLNMMAATPGESFNYFPLGLYPLIFQTIFPEKKYRQLVFGFPHLADQEYLASEHIWRKAKMTDEFIPIALASQEMNLTIPYLQNFSGLKMYRPHNNYKSKTKIIDIFPERILRTVNNMKGNIILHLPEDISHNLNELMSLANKYNDVHFILAHMGVAYVMSSEYPEILRTISRQSNIYLDTAMVSDAAIFLCALKEIGYKRILFGSDAPFSFINGDFCIDESGKLRLRTSDDFAWKKIGYPPADDNWPQNFFHYRIILALKQAINEFCPSGKNDSVKQDIFYNNALNLFS